MRDLTMNRCGIYGKLDHLIGNRNHRKTVMYLALALALFKIMKNFKFYIKKWPCESAQKITKYYLR